MLTFTNHNEILELTRKYLFQVLKFNKSKWEFEIYQKRHKVDALIEFPLSFPLSRITMVIIEQHGNKNPQLEALFKYDNEIMKFISIEVPEIEGAKWDISNIKL